jgi:biopolymer transport protein ExbD
MGMSSGKKGRISEINVTPLVDVMLVLLIIFMVTAPLMLNGIQMQLPKTQEVSPLNLTTSQVVLSMTLSGEVFVGKEKVLREELIDVLKNLMTENNTQTVFLRADFKLDYGKVASMMSHLKHNGVSNIALVTEIEKKK